MILNNSGTLKKREIAKIADILIDLGLIVRVLYL